MTTITVHLPDDLAEKFKTYFLNPEVAVQDYVVRTLRSLLSRWSRPTQRSHSGSASNPIVGRVHFSRGGDR